MSRQRRDEKQTGASGKTRTSNTPRYYRNTTVIEDIKESVRSAAQLMSPDPLKYRDKRIDDAVDAAVSGRRRR